MQLAHVKALEQKYLLGTYSRYELLADRGSGAYLFDKSNKRYLDLLAGIAVIAIVGLVLEKLVFERLENFTVVRWGMIR